MPSIVVGTSKSLFAAPILGTTNSLSNVAMDVSQTISITSFTDSLQQLQSACRTQRSMFTRKLRRRNARAHQTKTRLLADSTASAVFTNPGRNDSWSMARHQKSSWLWSALLARPSAKRGAECSATKWNGRSNYKSRLSMQRHLCMPTMCQDIAPSCSEHELLHYNRGQGAHGDHG